jgi:hypothetical protein
MGEYRTSNLAGEQKPFFPFSELLALFLAGQFPMFENGKIG